jgi:hypothetical protein
MSILVLISRAFNPCRRFSKTKMPDKRECSINKYAGYILVRV